jgi:hypothetical protein
MVIVKLVILMFNIFAKGDEMSYNSLAINLIMLLFKKKISMLISKMIML